ncbi:hypothetical protein BH11PSE12_BH11PSE12_18370 [soil metagenome]
MSHNRDNQINSLIRQAIPKQPTSPQNQASNQIHGNGNIVAGGNVTTVYRGGVPIASANQNMTDCPVCDAPVSINANTCLVCGDDLANNRVKARHRRVMWIMASLGLSGMTATYIGTHFSMPSLATGGFIATVLALMLNKS